MRRLQNCFLRDIQYKLDIGVHALNAVEQRDMDFDLSYIEAEKANLQANAPEQVFVEKLKSLLRLGAISSRGKDVFDMLYLTSVVNERRLKELIDVYIYADRKMRERSIEDIVNRLQNVFGDKGFMAMLSNRRMNWLQVSPDQATRRLVAYMESLD